MGLIPCKNLMPQPHSVCKVYNRLPRSLWDRYASQAEAEAGALEARAYIATGGSRSPSPVQHIEQEIRRLRDEVSKLLVGREVRFHPFRRRQFKAPMVIEKVAYDAQNSRFTALVLVQYSEEEAPGKSADDRWHGEWVSLSSFDWSNGDDAAKTQNEPAAPMKERRARNGD